MPVIATRAPGVPLPHTEQRSICAVAPSVTGTRGTVWLQNARGPAVTPMAEPASNAMPSARIAGPLRLIAR